MSVFKVQLDIFQGSTFTKSFTWSVNGTPVNLTGATAKFQIKTSASDTTPLLELTEASGIVLGGPTGVIEVKLTDEQTQALPSGNKVHGLKIYFPSGDARVLMQGMASVQETVVKD